MTEPTDEEEFEVEVTVQICAPTGSDDADIAELIATTLFTLESPVCVYGVHIGERTWMGDGK